MCLHLKLGNLKKVKKNSYKKNTTLTIIKNLSMENKCQLTHSKIFLFNLKHIYM